MGYPSSCGGYTVESLGVVRATHLHRCLLYTSYHTARGIQHPRVKGFAAFGELRHIVRQQITQKLPGATAAKIDDEIHICLIICFCCGDIAPVCVNLISIDSLKILVADQNILCKIMSAFQRSSLDQLCLLYTS